MNTMGTGTRIPSGQRWNAGARWGMLAGAHPNYKAAQR